MSRISPKQATALIKATPSNDHMVVAHRRVMNCLVEKGLAEWSQGYGFRFGGIIELTQLGKDARDRLTIHKSHLKGD